MEGSRHERAATVVVSYGIGFITAFILYASFNQIPPTNTFVKSTVTNTAALPNAVLPTEDLTVRSTEVVVLDTTVVYEDGELLVKKEDGEKLLSFNPRTTDYNADFSSLKQGYHYGVLNYTVSKDGDKVFFCERHDETNSSCLGFVYSVSLDTIYPIVKDGRAVTISEGSAKGAAWSSSGLTIGTNYSVNDATPWVLTD